MQLNQRMAGDVYASAEAKEKIGMRDNDVTIEWSTANLTVLFRFFDTTAIVTVQNMITRYNCTPSLLYKSSKKTKRTK